MKFLKLHTFLLLLTGGFLLAACGAVPRFGPMSPGFTSWGGSYETNGEQIYFTGTNDRGERIDYSGGPAGGGMMMGTGQLSCAACHGTDGRGGVHTMHMTTMAAPDIRIGASSEPDDHGGEVPDDGHGEENGHAETLGAFRQAVVNGIHANGERLDRNMPRWELSDQDLADLYSFLESLP